MQTKREGDRVVSGAKIREHREALKQRSGGRQGSQAWLAEQIGAHVTSVSDWERGVNQPSPRHLYAIAAALGISTDALFQETGGAPFHGEAA